MEDGDNMTYFRVSPKFWVDAKENGWDRDATILAAYLLFGPHRKMEGFYRLPKGYVEDDIGWLIKNINKPFEKLASDGFIQYDEDAKVVLVCKALKYQKPANENQMIAALKSLRELPKTRLWPSFQRFVDTFADDFGEWLRQRIPEHMGDSQSPSPTQSPSPIKRPRREYTVEFENFWVAYPRKEAKPAAYKCWKARLDEENVTVEKLTTACQHYAVYCKGKEEGYIMLPTTFLGPNERWQKYFDFAPPGNSVRPKLAENDVTRELREMRMRNGVQ